MQTFDDYYNSCYLALVSAVNYFDPEKEYELTTYCGFCIKLQFNELLGIRSRKTNTLNNCISLNNPISGDEGDKGEVMDTVADPNSGDVFDKIEQDDYNRALRNDLEKAIARCLNDRQAEVIRQRYFEGKSYTDIAENLGVSQYLINGGKSRALRELRRAKELQQYKAEILQSNAWKRQGLNAFKNSGISSVERAVELAETFEEIKLKGGELNGNKI